MTIEEAYDEMKRRGWGYARNRATGRIAIGPMDEDGWIHVLAIGNDPVETMKAAIIKAEGNSHAPNGIPNPEHS